VHREPLQGFPAEFDTPLLHMECQYCFEPFDPVKYRWLCPHCKMKNTCCEGNMTSGGVLLTDEYIEELAAEAERGYDPEKLVPRRITEK
jgi:hypothetical protein